MNMTEPEIREALDGTEETLNDQLSRSLNDIAQHKGAAFRAPEGSLIREAALECADDARNRRDRIARCLLALRKLRTLALCAALLAVIAGCGSTATHGTAAPQGLTYAQGAQICTELNAWIPGAQNQDTPRFSAAITAGMNLALDRKAQLGTDLENESYDLQDMNGIALFTGPVYDTQDSTGSLSQDCLAYGVTLNWDPDGG